MRVKSGSPDLYTSPAGIQSPRARGVVSRSSITERKHYSLHLHLDEDIARKVAVTVVRIAVVAAAAVAAAAHQSWDSGAQNGTDGPAGVAIALHIAVVRNLVLANIETQLEVR